MRRPRLRSSKAKVNKLVRLLGGRRRALLVVHDNPDPDGMAGAFCLSHLMGALLGVRALIVYGGIVGRAENRDMIRALGISLWRMEDVEFRPDDAVVLVDTQPAFRNHSLPEGCPVLAVIDHHAGCPSPDVPLVDVRPEYGAVTTIITEYLVSAGVRISPALATAICFGIGTETQDLGREAAPADIAAFMEAFPLSDLRLLGRLHHPRRDLSFFAEWDRALHAARVRDHVVVCHLAAVPTADTAAEMADMLAGLEGVEWVMCTGVCNGRLMVSVRTSDPHAQAGELLRDVVGDRARAGGHDMMAGGSLELDEAMGPAHVQLALTRRFLAALGFPPEAHLAPLIERGSDRPSGPGKGDSDEGGGAP